MGYRTCSFIRGDGSICKSAAAKRHSLCLYHRRHIARLMRMAQYRARLVACASDSVAKESEAASRKDAAPPFRSAKPSPSIGNNPQRDRKAKVLTSTPRTSPLQSQTA